MGNVVVWAGIPVEDLDRAGAFYSHVLGARVEAVLGAEGSVATLMVPGSNPDSGCAELAVGAVPPPKIAHGCAIYLSDTCEMDDVLARVIEAGGAVLKPKQFHPDVSGWIAWIKDSEGNSIGIQSSGQSLLAT